jgi:hypothetical protein
VALGLGQQAASDPAAMQIDTHSKQFHELWHEVDNERKRGSSATARSRIGEALSGAVPRLLPLYKLGINPTAVGKYGSQMGANTKSLIRTKTSLMDRFNSL